MFFDRSEIVDFGGLGGPGRPGTPLDRPGPPRTSTCTKNQPRRPLLRQFRWVFNIWFFDRQEIVDFVDLGGPGRPGNLPKGWGASPRTFLEGILTARSRPDPQNRRLEPDWSCFVNVRRWPVCLWIHLTACSGRAPESPICKQIKLDWNF